MSFVDTILSEDPKATLIVVDRNDKPGGHWVHAYPFCRLHQGSCHYGVNSMTLGENLNRKGNERWDIHDRATGQEVLDYYQRVRENFEATGRVTCFFGAEYQTFDAPTGFHIVATAAADDDDDTTNNKNDVDGGTVLLEVRCRRKLVTVETNIKVPSMRGPTVPVHEAASFVSVNALPASIRSGKFRNYVVFGCGKTGADAVVHLIRDGGVDPSRITWIVSRDAWYILRDSHEDCLPTVDRYLEPMVRCGSVHDVYLDWEANGIVGRLDKSILPEVFKGPIVTVAELEMMRSVGRIVRKGRAKAIERDTIVFAGDDGGDDSIGYDPDNTLLVDCMVDGFYGFDIPTDYRIFEPGRIRLGPLLYFWNTSFSAAHIAFVECAVKGRNNDRRVDAKKNRSCHFVRGKTPDEMGKTDVVIGYMCMQMMSTFGLVKLRGGMRFFLRSRTNILAPLHHKRGFLRLLWYSVGPTLWAVKSKQLEWKIRSKKGFTDLDHSFLLETLGGGGGGAKRTKQKAL